MILADEPTGSLDTATGDSVIELLANLPADRGTGVVLVTHEPRYAAWADRIVSMRDGRIISIAVAPDDVPSSVPAGAMSARAEAQTPARSSGRSRRPAAGHATRAVKYAIAPGERCSSPSSSRFRWPG